MKHLTRAKNDQLSFAAVHFHLIFSKPLEQVAQCRLHALSEIDDVPFVTFD